jgi:hypothetical protein
MCKTGQLIKNYTFERVENFKYLGVIVHDDKNHKLDLHERTKMQAKHTSC